MARSTDAQKAERLNAAHRLLARGTGMAEAVVLLSRQFGLSRRQAYRYVQEAQAIGHAVPIVAPSVPITLKLPANVVHEVRAKHQALFAAPRADHVQGRLSAGAIERPAQYFPVDRDNALALAGKFR